MTKAIDKDETVYTESFRKVYEEILASFFLKGDEVT
jgi:hypothetical protein